MRTPLCRAQKVLKEGSKASKAPGAKELGSFQASCEEDEGSAVCKEGASVHLWWEKGKHRSEEKS